MPRVTPVRRPVTELPRLADVHRDVSPAEFARNCEAALYIVWLEGVEHGEALPVGDFGGWGFGTADCCVADGEDEGVVEVGGGFGEEGMVAAD